MPEPLEPLQHALCCVVRIFRALLGQSAISDEKVGSGAALRVLGVDITMTLEYFLCMLAK